MDTASQLYGNCTKVKSLPSATMVNQSSLMPVRVMYSFPNKLGAGRICWTAWQQVFGLVNAGANLTVIAASTLSTPPGSVRLVKSLCIGRLRIPFRLIGARRALLLHDWIAARWLDRHAAEIDIVHVWPLGALRTIRAAKKHNIPTVLERPNTHTEFAYQTVEEECNRIGVTMPKGFEHKFDASILTHEIKEYSESDYLLCPSDFVKKTFIERNFPDEKLLRHQYGYDDKLYWPGRQGIDSNAGLVMIYAGLCTPRKGLHHALQAWLASDACRNGRFLICGEFMPGYRQKLSEMLGNSSVEVLGHCNNLPELMRQADIFVLPTVEEGSALVTYEARGSGCVLVVSDASGAVCSHMYDGLVHEARDVDSLTSHINLLERDRQLLARLRQASLSSLNQLTWSAAGNRLLEIYGKIISAHRKADSSGQLNR